MQGKGFSVLAQSRSATLSGTCHDSGCFQYHYSCHAMPR
jgi:hypothetical protein